MTTSVAEHYANHLAPIYSWMVGDLDEACAQADHFYSEIQLPPGNDAIAIDLGCGHGIHSIALARRGYRVVSLDTSSHLLGELEDAADGLSIQTVLADLAEFSDHVGNVPAALITCMGDTITHLASIDAVDQLLGDVARKLCPDGMATFSFRNYSSDALTGADRFIPVRSDESRVHTCFLEYLPDVVLVHDIIHTLVDSAWKTSVSAYPKIRLSPDQWLDLATSHGLSLVHESMERGMLYCAFRPAKR